jgi:type VI protein secretion system component Hcp
MRTIILMMLAMPFLSFAQKQDVFIKLTDAGGKLLNGDAVVKGFERNIQAQSTSSGGKNNTQFSFTMSISGVSADLKRTMNNGEQLLSGIVTATQTNGTGAPAVVYTIKMEKIKVNSCAELMGCNGVTTTSVTLTATRIGWTYYQQGRNVALTVSNKYGYDAETGGAWNNF